MLLRFITSISMSIIFSLAKPNRSINIASYLAKYPNYFGIAIILDIMNLIIKKCNNKYLCKQVSSKYTYSIIPYYFLLFSSYSLFSYCPLLF